MNRSKIAILALGVAAGAFGVTVVGVYGRIGPASAAPSATVVATVDMLALCIDAPDRAVIDAKRKASKDANDAWIKDHQKLLDDLNAKVSQAPEQLKREMQIAFEREKTTTEFDYKVRVGEAIRAHATNMSALYDKIRGAVSAVATQDGYTLVLYKTPQTEGLHLSDGTTQEFVVNVAMRTVLHGATEIDITQKVLAFLKK